MVGPFVGKQPGEVENKNGVSCYAQTAVQLLGFIPGVAERAATLRSAALAAAASGGVDDVPRCKVTSAFCDLFQIMFRARAAPANPTRFLLACGVEMNKKKSTPLFTQIIGRPRGAKQEDAAEFLRALLPILHAGGLPLYNIFNIVSTSMCCQCGAGEIFNIDYGEMMLTVAVVVEEEGGGQNNDESVGGLTLEYLLEQHFKNSHWNREDGCSECGEVGGGFATTPTIATNLPTVLFVELKRHWQPTTGEILKVGRHI
jgi:hypothetical protein